MKYRNLPRTGLSLSEVGFGVWTVATNWWGHIPDNEKAALLENAVDLGINFFDTADTYGEGFGEEVLAKHIGHHRHDIVIATKFGYDFYDTLTPRVGHQERPQKFEPEFIRFACEQSLPPSQHRLHRPLTNSTTPGSTRWKRKRSSRRWRNSRPRGKSATTAPPWAPILGGSRKARRP